MGFQSKGEGTAAPKGDTAGCCIIAALPLCPLGYVGSPGSTSAGPRGVHPSSKLSSHQHAAAWLLLTSQGQTAA